MCSAQISLTSQPRGKGCGCSQPLGQVAILDDAVNTVLRPCKFLVALFVSWVAGNFRYANPRTSTLEPFLPRLGSVDPRVKSLACREI
eukprot:1157890-Pelagomonas_calceolata.AAC.6